MIVDAAQRWRDRRASYRPAGEIIDTARYEVAPIEGPGSDAIAKAFVLRHHYSGSYPAARFRVGLYRAGELVGVAVFSQPANNRTLAIFPGDPREAVELGRFVLVDDVPGNGETFFLGRAFSILREAGIGGVVSFADPLPRQDAGGRVTFKGHLGTIYQAHNATYLGRARVDTLRLLPDGSTLHNRALAKIRARERGWRYAAAILERHGAAPLGEADCARTWLETWLPRLTRSIRHPGNFRYAWGLTRGVRRALPPSQRYPKLVAA